MKTYARFLCLGLILSLAWGLRARGEEQADLAYVSPEGVVVVDDDGRIIVTKDGGESQVVAEGWSGRAFLAGRRLVIVDEGRMAVFEPGSWQRI